MVKRIYICHDTKEGLFSALYDAWKECRETGEAGIAFYGSLESELFCEYVETIPNSKKANAVEQMIWKNMGKEAYGRIYQASKSMDSGKGTAIFQTMVAARKIKQSDKIMDHLTNPAVKKVHDLSRTVGNEELFFKEILRFRELKNGILYARIEPKHRIVEGIAPHFEGRLPMENWMIYDAVHQEFAVHEAGKRWILVSDVPIDGELLKDVSESEGEIQRLWKQFFHDISIKERESDIRQKRMLPLKYRKNMVEFE